MTTPARNQAQSMHDRYPPWLRVNITPFRVGLHALAFSSRTYRTPSPLEGFPTRFDVLGNGGTFNLKRGPNHRRPSRTLPFTRRVEYVHHRHGHRLIMFTDSSRLCGPRAYLKLIPGPGRLLSPQGLRHLLAPVAAHFRLDLMVSQGELAADFAIDSASFEKLAGVLHVPRTRGPRRIANDDGVTFYWGSRRSACQTKMYWRAGRGFGRLEHTFRRKALRRMGVRRPTDLLTVDWAEAASRRGRFVELDDTRPTRRPGAIPITHLRDFMLGLGLGAVLRPNSPRFRRSMKSRFVPLPVQKNLEAALAKLSGPRPLAAVGAVHAGPRDAGRAKHPHSGGRLQEKKVTGHGTNPRNERG